uniref:Glycoside hydrolase family 5 domain-containing protein n=1 Tax=Acrobeloides nanus TaxID=290746 RepID=A0A914CJY4_9BILA
MYLVSDAGNQLEMFQNDSFNPTLIDTEFALAETLGSNTMRIFLHDLAYEADPVGFKNRINTVLDIAAKHGIKPLLAIFDSCGGGDPKIGQQGQPDPGRMMSQWAQSPGVPVIENLNANLARLEAYVKDIVGTFANDTRVLGWDVFNEPPCGGQPETANLLQLLTLVFEWARSVDPIQPLTSPLFSTDIDKGNFQDYSAHSKIQVNNSDVISFHE